MEMRECKFSRGSKVRINDTAERAFEHIGQTAIVKDFSIRVIGERIISKSIESVCIYKLQFDDETTLDEVPESELSYL